MTPDIVILNGKLITFDAARPTASAIALTGGTIAALGSDAEVRALAAPTTRIIDAQGCTVLPGFIDSHVHLFQGAAELDSLNLHGVHGFDALAGAIHAYAADRPEEPVLFATAVDYRVLGPDAYATRHDLDRIISDRPFIMMAADHHTAWANTPALDAAGILDGAAVPLGSEIVMGADGRASGMLVETGAFGYVTALTKTGGRDFLGYVTGDNPVPPATPEQRAADKAAILRGQQHCASHGITTLHNMDGNFYQLELLQEMDEAGDLICRTEVPFHFKNFDPITRMTEAAAMRAQYQSDKVWCNRVKMFMDGVIESHTGLMTRPYPERPDTHGEAVFSPEQFNEACIAADALGLQICVHAVGDLAVRRTLDGYEAAQKANGARDARHRVEHIELVHPDDLPRFGALGVIASMQPLHSPAAGYFGPPAPGEFLHDDQRAYAFAWNLLRKHALRLCFSTDWPVVPVDVMPTIRGAVAPVDLGPGWPDCAQSLHDTLASYTCDNAFMEFNEDRKGRLIPGMMADLVILDHDIAAMVPATLDQARAAVTICDGKITFQA
ncbi:amidohydrolase [Actibacterium sp. D379-3]